MTLKTGDIVDLIAPSSVPKKNQCEKAFKLLKSWGLKPRFKAMAPVGFHSGSDLKRSFFLNKAFFNKDSKAVWMLRGGYGLQKLMPSFIKSYNPQLKKIFIGYSDGTALHLYLNGQKQKTLHAPVLGEMSSLDPKQVLFLKRVLFGLEHQVTFKNLYYSQKKSLKTNNKILKARILGGNLSLLSSSIGTKCCPSFKSCFLFIEDVNEAAYKIDRLLHHLFYSGALKGVKALLFGALKPLNQKAIRQVIKSFQQVCPLPMVFGLPCGHVLSHKVLPFGYPSTLILKSTGLKNRAELKISLKTGKK